MPVVVLEDLTAAGAGRLLGIDVGSKTLGLALSDETRTIASPLMTVRRGRFRDDAASLARIIGEHAVSGLVIGLPVSMDGREGPRCQSVRQFAANLSAHADLPMAFWDERWSTMAVERMLIGEADLSRKRRREVVDKQAAAYILQGAIDFLAGRRAAP
ncbi:MAG: Holliday junction resolvase RuvX [Rhodospirillales bacterium]|nr:Holliday junction resolvase RuvX [Rhodospirillales bacterium]